MGHGEKLDMRSSSLERCRRSGGVSRGELSARRERHVLRQRVEKSVDGRWSVHLIDPALLEMLPCLNLQQRRS